MDRNILLTYIHVDWYTTYEWFEDMEDELNYKIGEEL